MRTSRWVSVVGIAFAASMLSCTPDGGRRDSPTEAASTRTERSAKDGAPVEDAEEAARDDAATSSPERAAAETGEAPSMGRPAAAEPGAETRTSPDSGDLPPAQRREIERLTSRDASGLVPVEQPDGSVYIDLENRFQHVPVARVKEDGSIEVQEY